MPPAQSSPVAIHGLYVGDDVLTSVAQELPAARESRPETSYGNVAAYFTRDKLTGNLTTDSIRSLKITVVANQGICRTVVFERWFIPGFKLGNDSLCKHLT